MTLLESRATWKPLEYPQAIEYWRQQQRLHWLPEKVEMSNDVRDYRERLTNGEKNLLNKLFRFFTQGDIDVASGYYDKYIPVFGGKPEIRMMLGAFANMEGIHVVAYAHLLETLGLPDSEFTEFLKIKEMMDKHNYVQQFCPNPTSTGRDHYLKEVARTLAVYSAFTEGLSLFSSFAILMNFGRQGKMNGMNTIVEWSVRDENLHVEAMTWLFRTFIKEYPEIWTDEFKKELYDICREIVDLEDKFIDLCFSEAGEIEGLSATDVKKYIRFIADRRLGQLGLKPNYFIDENPLDYMDWMLGSKHTSFFERRVTSYAKSSKEGWDDVFDD